MDMIVQTALNDKRKGRVLNGANSYSCTSDGSTEKYEKTRSQYALYEYYKTRLKRERKRIRELCRKASLEHREAVLEYVTTDTPADTVCTRHFLSRSTLERVTRRYYMLFSQSL